jgi:hypothetical protein
MKFSSLYFIFFFTFSLTFVLAQVTEERKGIILLVPDVIDLNHEYDEPKKIQVTAAANCRDFNLNIIGIVGISGKVCLTPPEIEVCVTVFGNKIGPCIKGNTDKGVVISIDLFLIKGSLKFYRKGNCIRLAYSLDLRFGPDASGDVNVVCF